MAEKKECGIEHLTLSRTAITTLQYDITMTEKTNSKQAKAPDIQAMVWYRKEHWDSLMELFPDRHLLPATYEKWLTMAEEMKNKVEAGGDVVIKVFIDPETFPAWCKEQGKEMNSEARTELAIQVAQQQSFSA